MAYRTGIAVSDRGQVPASATLNNLTVFTFGALIRPLAETGLAEVILGKGTTAGASRRSLERQSGGTVRLVVDCATTDAQRVSGTRLVPGVPYAVFGTYDDADKTAHLFIGTLGQPPIEDTAGTNQVGNGALGDNSANAQMLMNAASTTNVCNGISGRLAVWPRILTQADMWNFANGETIPWGAVGEWYLGRAGNAYVLDETGHGNNGVIVGGALIPDPVLDGQGVYA